jgi:Family of unknown function (DUF6130)
VVRDRFGRRMVVAAIVVLLAGACSSDGGSPKSDTGSTPTSVSADRPASTAKLAIITPTNGQVVHGTTVQMKVRLNDATIVPATTTDIVPDEGHLHVILDDQLISMTGETTQLLSNLTPGQHLLKVEFVASDHAPFDPRVIAAVAFEVRA